MKYFVISDVHGFFSLMKQALDDNEFDEYNPDHKLIICGDVMDRGSEAILMENYIMRLLELNKVIIIRGNHEDLMLDMVNDFYNNIDEIAWGTSHHVSNGTFDTAQQLVNQFSIGRPFRNTDSFLNELKDSDFYKKIIPSTIDYFETKNYIFVHGWIPCIDSSDKSKTFHHRNNIKYKYNKNWRKASKKDWDAARWINGMEACETYGITEPEKTIVCGHWHTSFGHSKYEHDGSEFGKNANFSPYYSNGIIAIDGCTAYSNKVNCIVIED